MPTSSGSKLLELPSRNLRFCLVNSPLSLPSANTNRNRNKKKHKNLFNSNRFGQPDGAAWPPPPLSALLSPLCLGEGRVVAKSRQRARAKLSALRYFDLTGFIVSAT